MQKDKIRKKMRILIKEGRKFIFHIRYFLYKWKH